MLDRPSRLPSNVLSSQGEIPQLLSALKYLTSVFGMGTGVTTSLSPLDNYYINIIFMIRQHFRDKKDDQAYA